MVLRTCKNCTEPLPNEKSYCPNCGSKWIENRITARNVAADFSDLYIGIDTKFARTFKHLFTNPADVINGYINGRRVRHMDAIRYLLLAIFISGIYMVILKHFGTAFIQQDYTDMYSALNYSEEQIASMEATNKILYDIIFKYYSLIIFATIPFMAFIARVTFWGKQYYNYTEQLVFYLYTYAHITIASVPISILILLIKPDLIQYWSFLNLLIMFIYNTFSYKRCFKLNWEMAITKALVALIILFIVSVVMMFLAILGGFMYAYFINS